MIRPRKNILANLGLDVREFPYTPSQRLEPGCVRALELALIWTCARDLDVARLGPMTGSGV